MDLGAAHLTDETDLTYVLDADQGVGGIRVEGLASFDKTLQCIGSDGRAFSQTYNDGELCMFDRIPPGRYVVGPSEWAKQVFRTPAARKVYSVEVRSMETTVVRAGLAWRLDKPIQGSVVLSPGVKSPLLYLSYAMPVGQIVGQKACIGQVSKSGEYEVPQGQPVPCALIAADFWGGILRVRGVLELGEQRELSERVIVLKGNAVAEDQITVDIQYCYGNTWSRLDVSDSLRSVDFRVVVSNEPISFALHKSVEQLTFRRLVDGKRVTVPVAVGSKQVVDLSKIYEED
jgi:hypothetical protein